MFARCLISPVVQGGDISRIFGVMNGRHYSYNEDSMDILLLPDAGVGRVPEPYV